MEAREMMDSMSIEQQLKLAGETAVAEANSIIIKNQRDYDRAAEFLKEIKRRAKQMKEFWRPAKEAAKEAHAQICQREKAMLSPLEEAEKVVKKGMVGYQLAVAAAQIQAEQEAKRRQQEERDRLLAEAAEAEKSGDMQGAMVGMAMAEMVEDMKAPSTVSFEQAKGTSTRRRWRARVIDERAVPAYSGCIQLRKIDQSALDKLAAASEGTAQVPGVEFYQDTIISARA
ncbi:MAG: hypothetical protein ACI4MP_07110 [Candidatus Ventricola sp.]